MRNDAEMRREIAREALSARLDGERPQVLAQQIDAQLVCSRSRGSWLTGAAVQTRRLRSVAPGEGPDLLEKLMATIGEQRRRRQARMRWLRRHYRRWGLIAV